MQAVEADKRTEERPESQAGLRMCLLGGFRVERDGHEIPASRWKRRSARRVMALLALAPGHQLHRDQILDTFWPDLPPEAALNNLHQALHAARRVLEPDLSSKRPSAYLRMTDNVVALVADHVTVDLDEALRLAQDALGSRDTALHEGAIAAVAAELLPEERYEDWTAEQRDIVAALRLRLMVELAALLESSGAYPEAGIWLHRAVELDETREDLHRRLMRLYMRLGSRHQALRQYHHCAQVLLRELGVDPDAETEQLHQEILAGSTRGSNVPEVPAILRRLPAGALVARQESLGLLQRELDGARDGEGGLVLVSGEAGVGKTRLITELARDASDQGFAVLWGTSYAGESLLPYGAVSQALDDWAMRRPESLRRDLGERYQELARMVPAFAGYAQLHGGDAGREEPARLFAATARLLTEIAERAPLVLVLDDLHGADVSTIQLLRYLARTAVERPWLILGAYRTGELARDSDLQCLVEVAHRQNLARSVELLRLAPEETRQLAHALLAGDATPQLIDYLYTHSLGNPLFVHELLRAMQERGNIIARDGSWELVEPAAEVVPPGVKELVSGRVARAGKEAQHVLELAAVVGMEVPFDLLRAAELLPERVLVDALEWALESEILEERSDDYAFRHPLFRSALYDRLSLARRAAMHGEVVRTLERIAPERVEALAYHAVRGRLVDEAPVYLERAGDRARMAYANDVAETYYRDALGLLSSATDTAQQARVREKLGAVLITLSRYSEALCELAQAAEAYESYGDLAGAVTTAAKIGETHFLRGTSEEGLQRVRPLISRLERDEDVAVPGECAATLYLTLALLSWAVTRFDEQLEAAERARQLAQQDRTRVDAEVRRVQAMIGRAEEALHALEAILPTAEQLDDLELRRRALAMAAVLCEGTGRVERCIDYRRRALAVAERSGNPAMIATSLSHLGGILGWSGHWAEARSCYERSVAIFRSLPASFYAAWPILGLSGVSWWSGDLESGWAYAHEAREIAESDGNMEASWHAHNGLAEIELLRGQPEAAYERIHSFLSQPQLATADPLYVADAYPLYAKVSLAAGHHERAEEISAAAVALNRQANLLVALCEALWVRGMVLASQARWQEAESHFEEAVSIARSLPHPRQEALALHEYGAMLVASGKAERGGARLEEALTVFRRLGARLDADRTERMLAELGSSARQASRRAP